MGGPLSKQRAERTGGPVVCQGPREAFNPVATCSPLHINKPTKSPPALLLASHSYVDMHRSLPDCQRERGKKKEKEKGVKAEKETIMKEEKKKIQRPNRWLSSHWHNAAALLFSDTLPPCSRAAADTWISSKGGKMALCQPATCHVTSYPEVWFFNHPTYVVQRCTFRCTDKSRHMHSLIYFEVKRGSWDD